MQAHERKQTRKWKQAREWKQPLPPHSLLPQVRLWSSEDNDTVNSQGVAGELHVKGDTVFKEYVARMRTKRAYLSDERNARAKRVWTIVCACGN